MKHIVEDNFLAPEDLSNIQELMFSNNIPMHYCDTVGHWKDKKQIGQYYFSLLLYQYPMGWQSKYAEAMQPILKKLDAKAICRIKINWYPRSEKITQHTPHVDQDFKCKSSLFYVNTNDGFTKIKDGNLKIGFYSIESVENRVLHFDSSNPHFSTNCTDQNLRCTINFNYF